MAEQKHVILGVGAVVFHERQVLLVKRGKPPFINQWAIPGGKVKFGESLRQAAEREILEETGVTIEAGEPVYTFEVIPDNEHATQTHYVVIDLEARFISGTPYPNDDVVDAAWVDATKITKIDVNEITRDLLQLKYQFP